MGPIRAGEAEGVSFGGAGEKKRPHEHEGEAASMSPGGDDEKRRGRVIEPAGKGLDGREAAFRYPDSAKKPPSYEGEASSMSPGGDDEKRRGRVIEPAGKGLDGREAAFRYSDGAKKPPRYEGEAASMSPGGDSKKRRISSPPPPVTERTPFLLAEALQSNGPPPPRCLIASVSDKADAKEYNPYDDLFFFGRPESEAWYAIWRRRPLELHDAGLVAAVDSVVFLGRRYTDVSEDITRVLETHPGPVSTLRVDCSEFPNLHLLSRWMALLSLKLVKKLILINVTRPIEGTEVPLDRLCSSRLTYLGVGFVDLRNCLKSFGSAGEKGHPWCSLKHLNLTACLFVGSHLAQTVKNLQGLETIRISNCELTRGCDQDGFQIESPNIIAVIFSSCTAAAKLVVGRAPKLDTLHLGVRDVSSSATCLAIHIRSCNLRELSALSLTCHDIKVNRCFRGLKCLSTEVDVTTVSGIEAFHRLLTMAPCLERLEVTFAHSEDSDVQELHSLELNSLPAITNSLKHLTVSNFSGGTAEIRLIIAIFARAQRLASVTVHPDSTMPVSLRQTAEFLKELPIANKQCRIRVGP